VIIESVTRTQMDEEMLHEEISLSELWVYVPYILESYPHPFYVSEG